MQPASFDPTRPTATKLNTALREAPPVDRVSLKASIAARVRADSRERRALTPEAPVQELAEGLSREELRALLAEMGAEGEYGDIQGVVAPSGRVYLFSQAHLIALEAQDQARLEEAKLALVERIRADSRRYALTRAEDLEPLLPSPDPLARAALLAAVAADPRFEDVRTLEGPKGERYYHSDAFVSGNYGKILMRAQAGDPCASIAELVRDRSRTVPSPTRVSTFEDPVFAVAPGRLDAVVAETLARFADVKRLVHPETGAVYLYSDQWLSAEAAFAGADWAEVGALRNP